MESVETARAPAVIGPYSQAVRAGDFLFCSGQIPLDPTTQQLVAGNVGEQTVRCLQNLTGVLEAAGLSLATVVKTTVFMVDITKFSEMNDAYAGYFARSAPARSTVEVSALPKGAEVEIEAIAFVGSRD